MINIISIVSIYNRVGPGRKSRRQVFWRRSTTNDMISWENIENYQKISLYTKNKKKLSSGYMLSVRIPHSTYYFRILLPTVRIFGVFCQPTWRI